LGIHLSPISQKRKKVLKQFERTIKIRFRSLELLNLAFCHRSFANESGNSKANNEKLEFLGDSVLGLAASEYLYHSLKEQNEGELARVKSFVVSENSLAQISITLGVNELILIGKGEEQSGGRKKKAILADAMEAIIGAYFLDSGYKAAKDFVVGLLKPVVKSVVENRHEKDYKTLLQEIVQKRYKSFPKYRIVKKSGPDHNKIFWVVVTVGDREFGPAEGRNKKEAEQRAAAEAFQSIGKS
jgi:ribonuclease-3